MLSVLNSFIQTRRDKLVTYLNNNVDVLPLEKQHQIYGAITELDSITEILKNHREREIYVERNPDEISLFKPIHDKGVIKYFVDFIRDLF
jgi:hypothetical protein